MRRLCLSLVAVAAIGLAAACGGDDDDAPAGASRPAAATSAGTAPSASPSTTAEAAPVLPASVTDKDGTIVKVADISRIIVLNGDLAEVVYALGLGENVVGVDTSATYPAEAVKKQNIGYQRTLAAEGILSLRPTLVLGNETAGPPAVISQIKGAGTTTVILKDVYDLAGVSSKVTSVAAALGVPERGKQLVAKIEKEIAEARALAARATSRPNVVFLYLRGANTQLIMGKGSRADVMLEAAGAIDGGVAAGVTGNKPITAEALLAGQPDMFLVLTAGLQSVGGIHGLLKIPGLSDTPAGRAKRVIDLDDQYLLGLGPRTGLALADLVRAIHPEVK